MSSPLENAIAHHRSGRLDAAEWSYRTWLDAEPDHPDALNLLGVVLCQKGRMIEALEWIERAIGRRPDRAAYHGNRGEVLRELGRDDEAAIALENALTLDPGLATAHNNLGLIHLHNGRVDQALASFGEAVRLRPDFAIAHVNRGDAFETLGRLDEAAAAYRRALEIDPENAWVHAYLGHVLVELGGIDRLDEALEHCRRACALAPGLAQAQTNLGNVLAAMWRHEEALDAYRRAVALDPTLAIPWNNIGRAEQHLGRFDAASAAYENALARDPRAARVHANLASLLAEQDRLDAAVARYRIALQCDPNYAESHDGLALVLVALGRRGEARAAIEEAIRLNPRLVSPQINLARHLAEDGDFERSNAHARIALALHPQSADAYFLLAMNLRDRLPDAELQAMTALLNRKYLSDEALGALGFSIAAVLDARGLYEEAVAILEVANARQAAARARRGETFDRDRSARDVSEAIASFTPEVFSALRGLGSPSRRPIFVVGMPRSGTSLVEQILASHPRIFGAGELLDVPRLARELAGASERPSALVRTLLALGPASIRALADRYLGRFDEFDRSAEHVVDKLPGNYINIGLIAVLWPEARVIVCRRDPRDIAFSCWATYFKELRWANDLRHIAAQIIDHDRLIAHWKTVLPSPMIEVCYEALVADFEPQTRRLIAALGLPWDPACLDFHRLNRPVRTASLEQVRQPIYSRSVGRWKNYQAALAPVFETLAGHL